LDIPFRKHLLGIEELDRKEILAVLKGADRFKDPQGGIRSMPLLIGKVVCNLFLEPSTRTSTSFALAARHLGAQVIGMGGASTSLSKGESLRDTARNIEAMGVDALVIRHQACGAPHQVAAAVSPSVSVINAGDGSHEHPTQALLDLYTIRSHRTSFEGLKVAIVGDIMHSRVARSNIWGLKKLGAEVTVVGPATLVPRQIRSLGVEVCHDLDRVLEDYDVFNFLRIQLERQQRHLFPSIREYAHLYGMNAERARRLKPNALILHPGPVNRGVELSPEVADGAQSVILEQVRNGILVRMAVLALLLGADPGSG
jgi:aspartate carbamoyltransferase catalytic subunit